MSDSKFDDLVAFLMVVREGSFTRAAAKLGVSQSALSHTLRRLETRLGIRLLTRSTRSLSPTDAGQRLIDRLGPHFEQIHTELNGLSALRDKPAGTIRITAGEHAASIVWPAMSPFLKRYPDIKLELIVDYGLTDIVTQRFDAGIRLGEDVARGMIAARVGPDMRMAVVGAPSYFDKHPVPRKPQQLTDHVCINLRLPTHGGLYPWELERGRRTLNIRVDGQLVFNNLLLRINAALDGSGLALLPEDVVRPYIAEGRLKSVLEEWCPSFPGYHLYYPSRRQASSAFALLVEALRYRD